MISLLVWNICNSQFLVLTDRTAVLPPSQKSEDRLPLSEDWHIVLSRSTRFCTVVIILKEEFIFSETQYRFKVKATLMLMSTPD